MSKVLVTESHLEDIADAIRAKNGLETEYRPGDMAAAIAAIPNSYAAGDEGKVVSNGELVAQTARAQEIIANGTYDTTLNDEVTVNVSGGSATLITKSITQNGTYNASNDNADGYSSVTVNVPGGGGGMSPLIQSIPVNGVQSNYADGATTFTASEAGEYLGFSLDMHTNPSVNSGSAVATTGTANAAQDSTYSVTGPRAMSSAVKQVTLAQGDTITLSNDAHSAGVSGQIHFVGKVSGKVSTITHISDTLVADTSTVNWSNTLVAGRYLIAGLTTYNRALSLGQISLQILADNACMLYKSCIYKKDSADVNAIMAEVVLDVQQDVVFTVVGAASGWSATGLAIYKLD